MGKKFSTLLIDGNWNLKRNYHKRGNLYASNGKLCGGTYGFIDSLRSVIQKTIPDRVIVFWDGFHAGKFRHAIYPPYKAKRKINWDNEDRIISTNGLLSLEDTKKFEVLTQKIDIQNILEDLFVRQLEIEYIEADDLIAYYCLNSKLPDEHIYIFSKDKDFLQLISENVSVITQNNFETLTHLNFKEKRGYTIENELLFKCFNGDDSDEIDGVNGITIEAILKYFPGTKDRKYTYMELVNECYEEKKDKKKSKRKIYDKIIDAQEILYRNAKLMNLKQPFINKQVVDEMKSIMHGQLDFSDRSIQNAMNIFTKFGFMNLIYNNNIDYFFAPFFILSSKEKNFSY